MKILILLSNPFQSRAFDRAIDHDRHAVSYIGTKDDLATIPSQLRCGKFEIADNVTFFEGSLKVFGEAPGFDRVLALWEDVLLDGARLRERWSVDGAGVQDVTSVTDKSVMKQLVIAAGIRVPKSCAMDQLCATSEAEKPWNGKTILKPKSEASSRGIKVFPSFKDASAFLKSCDSETKEAYVKSYVVEEFVEGVVCNANGLVAEGRVVCCRVARYGGTNLEYSHGAAATSISMMADDGLSNWIEDVTKAVGIQSGAFHLEFFMTDSSPVFMEIANRCGGGPFVDEFELMTGIHLPSAEIAMYIDDSSRYNWKMYYKKDDSTFGTFAIPGHHLPDGYARISNLEYLHDHPAAVKIDVLPCDRKLPRHVTYQCGRIPVAGIIKGPNEKVVSRHLEEILAKVTVESTDTPD